MGHWGVIACVFAAGIGVLMFLSLIADEVEALEQSIELRRRVEEDKAREEADVEVAA